MLTKEPEMLQLDAFCEHTVQQNVTAAMALPRTSLGELTPPPQIPWLVSRGRGREREGRRGEEKGRRGTGREGKGREGEVDSDAHLEQGRRLAKAGPALTNISSFFTFCYAFLHFI